MLTAKKIPLTPSLSPWWGICANLTQLPMWVGVFEASAGETPNDFAGRIAGFPK